MDDGEKHIGVKEKMLKKAEGIHYECIPIHYWQMFEILVSFCGDHPNEFIKWKKDNLEQIKEEWEKKNKKLKK